MNRCVVGLHRLEYGLQRRPCAHRRFERISFESSFEYHPDGYGQNAATGQRRLAVVEQSDRPSVGDN